MVTKEEILKIANLSKIYVSEDELESLTHDMAQIIAFADTVNAVSAGTQEFEGISGRSNILREDEVVPSYPREEILKNVGGGEDGYFPVKKKN